jgi:flagellar basal body rod protein FlgC
VNEFALLESAARGMTAQRTILDVAARNVAAAQAAVPGHPYQRLVASLTAPASADDPIGDAGLPPEMVAIEGAGEDDGGPAGLPVTIAREPGTGDALTELIAVLDAQRAYEANASIFDTGKRLAERTLDIDR